MIEPLRPAWRAAVALCVGLALAGCGGGGGTPTGSTAGTTTAGTRAPSNFDFGGNNPLKVTAFGDSITQGELGEPGLQPRTLFQRTRTSFLRTSNNYPNNLQNMLRGLDASWRVVNRGVGGETSGAGVRRFGAVLAIDRPGYVLIMEGANDVDRDTSPAEIAGNLEAMVNAAIGNHTIPIVGTITPNFRNDPNAQFVISQTNPLIRSMAKTKNVTLAEIFDGMNDRSLFGTPELGIIDPLHPNERGYVTMAGIWFDAMQKTIPVAAPPPPPPTPPGSGSPPPDLGLRFRKKQ